MGRRRGRPDPDGPGDSPRRRPGHRPRPHRPADLPANPFNDIAEDGHRETYRALIAALEPLGLAYLHIAEAEDRELTLELRKTWSGTLILNPGTPGRCTGPQDLHLIEDGTADLLSFATMFLANPDLPARLAAGGPFNAPVRATFYGGDERGYTDYPVLAG